jgi:succinate dehydrogenase hydrophobic anchor subunit
MSDRKLWTWHILAGVVILVLLGLHMIIMHLDDLIGIFKSESGTVSYDSVVLRGKTLFFTVSYILLLGAALFHGFYGLRNILFELSPSRGLKTAINAVLVLGGLGLFVFGTWAALASHQLAQRL